MTKLLRQSSKTWVDATLANVRRALLDRDANTAAKIIHACLDDCASLHLDLPNASLELAELFEHAAAVLENASSHVTASVFKRRAAAIRTALAQRVEDPAFTELLLKPMVIGSLLRAETRFFELMQIATPIAWNALNRPREQVAFNPCIEEFRACFAGQTINEVIWLLDLYSPERDKRGFTGYERFQREAMKPQTFVEGERFRPQVLSRGTFETGYLKNGNVMWTRVGWYHARIIDVTRA